MVHHHIKPFIIQSKKNVKGHHIITKTLSLFRYLTTLGWRFFFCFFVFPSRTKFQDQKVEAEATRLEHIILKAAAAATNFSSLNKPKKNDN